MNQDMTSSLLKDVHLDAISTCYLHSPVLQCNVPVLQIIGSWDPKGYIYMFIGS